MIRKREDDFHMTNVSNHGFCLLLEAEDLFVPFSEFPWFNDAPIANQTNVERPQSHYLYRGRRRRATASCAVR